MSCEDESDYRTFAYMQRYMEANKLYDKRLKGLRFCGQGVLPIHKAAFVITDGKSARYSTLLRCGSVWACPHCAPKKMAEKGSDIACAIDAMATWFHQKAAMFTFTIPHDKYMSCEDSYEILLATWKYFNSTGKRSHSRVTKYTLKSSTDKENKSYAENGNYQRDSQSYRISKRTGQRIKNGTKSCTRGTTNKYDKRAVGQAGEVREYKSGYDPYGDMRVTLQLDYHVKVYEFTYGENGWHPHIHMLAFFPEHNLQRVKDYEEKIIDRWWHCSKTQALKYYNKKYPDKLEENKRRVDTVYADYKIRPKDGHRCFYVSKDKRGQVIAQKSSYYIAGWSGNMEMTGSCNAKRARDGHLTPFQMLEKSCRSAVEAKKWMPLFIEYATITRGHRRVEFSSRPSLMQIVKKWKQTEQYAITTKKNITAAEMRPWRVVAWFSKEQWYNLCQWDVQTDEEIRKTILELARAPDPWLAIAMFVARFGVHLSPYEHPSQKFFEQNIYENKLLAELGA